MSGSTPKIILTIVAEGVKVLVSEGDQKFERLVEKLLEEVEGVQRKAYVHEEFSFNYISTKEGLIFVAVCDEAFPTKTAFAYLQHIESKFNPAQASKFGSTIEKEMQTFSDPAKVDKIEAIKGELNAVKDVMKENIEKVMERGVILESLEASTEALEADSRQFMNKATQLHSTLWWKNQKLRIALAVVVLLLIFFILWGACGATFQHCGNSGAPEPGPPAPQPGPQPAPQPEPAPGN